MTQLPHDQIAHRSFLIWQQAGCPDGLALDHWLQAERELDGLFNPLPRPLLEGYGKTPAKAAQKKAADSKGRKTSSAPAGSRAKKPTGDKGGVRG